MKPKTELQMLMYMKRIEQKEIADFLGKNQSTISRWLKDPFGKHNEEIMYAISRIEGMMNGTGKEL